MKSWHLARTQWFPKPVGDVFPFFADPYNLSSITPPWLRFEFLARGALEMRQGLQIHYRIRLHGVPMRWQSEISVWDPPHRFVDEQRRGPYQFWIHEHTFEPVEQGTLVGDHVEYAVPGGSLARKILVERSLERIFDFRRRKLEEIFGKDKRRGTIVPGDHLHPSV